MTWSFCDYLRHPRTVVFNRLAADRVPVDVSTDEERERGNECREDEMSETEAPHAGQYWNPA